MATKNDITGDSIRSKALSKQGRDNWDTIFGKKNPVKKNMDKFHRPSTHPDKTKYERTDKHKTPHSDE
jgi:hypothetical protein|tara:strand:+ start:314 stop:517 length:204 start_codon:yes stop_codon:yes gene_type:complete